MPTPVTERPGPAPTAGRERRDAPREAGAVHDSDLERIHSIPAPTPRSRQPCRVCLGLGGVPIFGNTRAGQAQRLARDQARKLNQLPDSPSTGYTDALPRPGNVRHGESRRFA